MGRAHAFSGNPRSQLAFQATREVFMSKVKKLPAAAILMAAVVGSGCVSYSRTTRTEPAPPPAAVVTPVPGSAVVTTTPTSTTTTTTVR